MQLLQFAPAHLLSTSAFLDHLCNVSSESDYVMVSFDVTSPYTNVSNLAAMRTIFELRGEHREHVNLFGQLYNFQMVWNTADRFEV